MAAAVTALFIAGLGVLAAHQSGPGRLAVVVRDPESSIGTLVTVKGRVEEVVSAKSFTLTADDERILVVDVSTIPALDDNLDEVLINERVEVTGTLRLFNLEQIEAQIGDLLDVRFERFAGEPVVIAEAVFPR